MQQTNESDDRLRGIDTKTVSERGLRSFFSVFFAGEDEHEQRVAQRKDERVVVGNYLFFVEEERV